ncbi:MAG TPA: hypothetical protein VNF99_14375 [Stellaceae bacterium]|nr:hypothetical protein [Stellaceae bacterium]
MTDSLRKLWGERRPLVDVKPGHRFFRRRRGNVTETATVVDLRSDIVGIPHVHFSLAFEEAAIGYIDGGNRVLALPSFVAIYQQRA